MTEFIVGDNIVDPNGNILRPVKEAEPEKATGPFSSLTPAVQKALEAAGITTVEQAKDKGRDGLIKLEGIGDKSADAIMALGAAE